MCVGVSVWLVWSGIRVSGWSHSKPTTPKLQHTSNQEQYDQCGKQNSRKLLMMDILMSEICWAHKKWNKIASDIKLVFYSSANGKVGNRTKSLLNLYTSKTKLRFYKFSSRYVFRLCFSTVCCRVNLQLYKVLMGKQAGSIFREA